MNAKAEHVGWVAEPAGRGTFGLLVSCGTTIFLCTYSAVHPNLPGLRDSAWKIQLRKLSYMLWCICAPEWFACAAVVNFATVRNLEREYKIIDPMTNATWSLKRFYFAMMGGFIVQVNSTQKMLFGVRETLQLIQKDIVEFPTLEDKDIDDRSKASWVTKSLALIQISWFLTQLLARAIQQLPVTTLELYTLSIVCCASFTYGFNWHKPFDVQRPVALQAKDSAYPWPAMKKRIGLMEDDRYSDTTLSVIMLPVIVGIFASCHLIGWEFAFPSEVEQWLWRVGSLLCFVLPIVIASLGATDVVILDDMLVFALIGFYILVRVALFVEMFTSLRSVPAGVYQTPSWTNYFPSFGA